MPDPAPPRDTAPEDSGDTGGYEAPWDSGCPSVVQGSGLGCRAGEDTGCLDLQDKPDGEGTEAPGSVIGGAGHCGTAVPAAWLSVLIVLLATARRWGPLLVTLLFLIPPAHAGVDAQHVQIEGGAFPALREADLGEAWEASGTASLDLAAGLVRIVGGSDSRVLLMQVLTQDYSASANLGGVVRVGATVPVHSKIVFDSVSYKKTLGDPGFWAAVPIVDGESLHMAWYVQADAAKGPSDLYLGDPRGGVSGVLALSRDLGRSLEGLVNLGLRLQASTMLPGLTWGKHWTYGIGTRWEPSGRAFLTWELLGSVPLALDGDVGGYPLETLLSGGIRAGSWVSLGMGAGAGITRGLGSPTWRVVGYADFRKVGDKDTDGDGINDFRDLCRLVPEDVDGFKDQDGCPDPDNDRDGILDPDDACPRRAEVFNTWEDEDGCPDSAGWLVLAVTSPQEELEVAEVVLSSPELDDAEESRFAVFVGEPVRKLLPGESVRVEVSAPRHHTWSGEAPLWARDTELLVRLEPMLYGEVRLKVTDEEGAPLEAQVLRDGVLEPVPGGEARLEVPTGHHEWTVHAAGHRPARVEVDVASWGFVTVDVTLSPLRFEVHGARLVVREDVRFAVDSDQLEPVSDAVLAEVATHLLQHPEIKLLRVEGHADDTGTSAHNYDLSSRRAQAVAQRFEQLGVAPERLQAVGSGEALPREGVDCTEEDSRCASRRVEFLVLVWEEDKSP